MPWAKFTDKLHDSDKVGGVSDAAFRLWVLTITWSNEELTDGHVPSSRPLRLMALRNPKKTTAELVAAKLWHLAARPCAECLKKREEKRVTDPIPSGGWLIHDYLEFQRPAWFVRAERERLRLIGSAGGRASTQSRTDEQAVNSSTALEHDAQASSSSRMLKQDGQPSSSSEMVEHPAQAKSSSTALNPRLPVPPSSGSIDPVVLEPGGTDRKSDLGRGRRGGLRPAGAIAAEFVASARAGR